MTKGIDTTNQNLVFYVPFQFGMRKSPVKILGQSLERARPTCLQLSKDRLSRPVALLSASSPVKVPMPESFKLVSRGKSHTAARPMLPSRLSSTTVKLLSERSIPRVSPETLPQENSDTVVRGGPRAPRPFSHASLKSPLCHSNPASFSPRSATGSGIRKPLPLKLQQKQKTVLD